MQFLIHRSRRESGGSCIELMARNSRIVLDFGTPPVSALEGLPFDPELLEGKSIEELKELKILPDIKGLYKDEEKKVDALLISCAHLGSSGLLQYVNRDIPVYLSKGAKELIEISNIFTPRASGKINANLIHSKKPFVIGDFTVTPYLVDASAFDALAFLIEGDSKRLFYSSDFRGHGKKSELYERLVKEPPGHIDCLLMECTTRGKDTRLYYEDEKAAQLRIEQLLKERKNITFLFASSGNIDRLVSAYRACIRTNSVFVIDLYTACILEKLRKISGNIPQFNWKNIRIRFLKDDADRLNDFGYRDLLYAYNKRKIDSFEINRATHKILMLARDNAAFTLMAKDIDGIQGAKIIYSMPEGYLTDAFRQYCEAKGFAIEQMHTSGSAAAEDLKNFSGAVKPEIIVPIHAFEAGKCPGFLQNVRALKEGQAGEC